MNRIAVVSHNYVEFKRYCQDLAEQGKSCLEPCFSGFMLDGAYLFYVSNPERLLGYYDDYELRFVGQYCLRNDLEEIKGIYQNNRLSTEANKWKNSKSKLKS